MSISKGFYLLEKLLQNVPWHRSVMFWKDCLNVYDTGNSFKSLQKNRHADFNLPSAADEGQTVCHGPPELAGQRLAEVGMQLRADCHQGLGYWDYLFLIAIGFVIFSAGTVSAWVMGVLMVLYERYSKRKSEELDSDHEDRGGISGGAGGAGEGNQGNGDVSKPNIQV